ncbi:23S rRNA (uracil(1939)-C(5))-methyltransferase RlmD [Fundicoccus culcitae]|uniref:23S rRNA (Uracil(1939)-C(5))-methyltransferase RlmD n=1 Tax=Fundicoccus culcitae TaxID=2969821 RepID=A0ABY5PAE9_9LACT|nr:23S rRNA (uracil(1939)-C(5))-methyltransferase RlmD [Fundicoccus culcitae]UUX35463.1 23S rRNA (uracil(1939)-C(5))-methyltransferase RlmD [Fundicoccus culcitae]
MKNLSKNQILKSSVLDLTSQGEGVVKIDHFPIFVEGALPGETIEFKIVKLGKKFGYGRLLKIIQASPHRVEAKDDVGRQIGTMTLQHLEYSEQLKFKQKLVKDAFERIGKFSQLTIHPTIGMEKPWEYRNKAQIPVRQINNQLETGFFRKNSHDLIPIENYYIQHPVIDQTILTVRNILRQLHISAYNEESHTGLVRHIIVKRGHYTEEIMVVFVLNGKKMLHEQALVQAMVDQIPHLVSIVANFQTKETNVIMGRENSVLWGQAFYEDEMLGLRFKISAQSFYQVNTPQAERLYQTAIDYAQLSGTETVLDAYCGIGSISLALAQSAKQVYAMEVVAEAIAMAKENARLNQIENVSFEVGKAEDVLPNWQKEGIHFDVAVVDPPRKGLDQQFIQTLTELAPQRIVYVSCNPATCARDCRLIADAGYTIDEIQPVDLFGQTVHTEVVVKLSQP